MSGIGTAIAQGILDVIGQAEGSGVGEATAQALRIMVLTYEEYEALLARIVELELALEPKAHIRI
ncbi:unnamed protein product [marine sediment metagenome]|uniref:Uncharacterized protein n=1 Tax=marine sediment metagenome TaxID=412755 RepID=X1PT49_9ZZZZ